MKNIKNEITARRIRDALQSANISQQELADRSGVSKASISQYINGVHVPGNLKAGKIGSVLNVNPLWLMGLDDNEKLSRIEVKVSDNETELLEIFRALNNEGKRQLLMQAHLLANSKDFLNHAPLSEKHAI